MNEHDQVVTDVDKWQQAIEDAKVKIEDCRRRIRDLGMAVLVFEELKKAGVIWPRKKIS